MAKQTKQQQNGAEQQVESEEGFESLQAGGGDFDEFLNAEDLKEGTKVRGIVTGAKLLPDEGKGYRVVYALQLTAPLGQHTKGALVGLGERAKLRALRSVKVGSEVLVTALGKQKLKGGKTMHTFDLKAKPNTVTGAMTVEQVLSAAWKASGASAPWEQVAQSSEFEPGSNG